MHRPVGATRTGITGIRSALDAIIAVDDLTRANIAAAPISAGAGITIIAGALGLTSLPLTTLTNAFAGATTDRSHGLTQGRRRTLHLVVGEPVAVIVFAVTCLTGQLQGDLVKGRLEALLVQGLVVAEIRGGHVGPFRVAVGQCGQAGLGHQVVVEHVHRCAEAQDEGLDAQGG